MNPSEFKAFRQLDARGLALLDYWRQHLPTDYRRLKRKGGIYRFILGQQESYHNMADALSKCNMPPGGAEEILSEAFYPESEEDRAIREQEERLLESD